MTRKTDKPSVRLPAEEREELWATVLKMIGEPKVGLLADDFWDPERDVHFRPARFLAEPIGTRRAVETLVNEYKGLIAQEQAVDQVSPSLIRSKTEKIRNDLLTAAASLENLSQAELRVIVETAPDSVDALIRELIPLTWPGPDGRSSLSADLRQKVDAFDLILTSMRSRQPDTAWEGKSGRGHSILRHLGIAPASWQLVHMMSRLFEDFDRPRPGKEQLTELGSYIHQLATGEIDCDLKAHVSRYLDLRPEYDALARQLRLVTPKYNLDTFFQLQDYVGRRMASPGPPEQIQSLHRMIEQYLDIRAQLTAGPKPLPRKPPKNS